MKIHNLIQGSQAWLDFRKKGIGASEIPAIMGSSRFSNKEKLFLQKIGEVPETTSNFAMSKGSRLEPWAREQFKMQSGDDYQPLVVSHDKHEWAFASLDGYHVNEMNSSDSAICEIKLVGLKAWEDAHKGIIELAHIHQMQFQMFVTGAKVGFYVCYINEFTKICTVEVLPDTDMQAELFKHAQHFYNCVITGTPPSEPIADDLIELIEKYESVSKHVKMLEESLDEIKAQVRDITPMRQDEVFRR